LKDSDWKDIRHFTKEEFACKCGCGISNPKKSFVERLDRAREHAMIPFHVVSGSRCAEHNASRDVGGVDSSAHLASEDRESTAVDLGIWDSRTRFDIIDALRSAGFTRLGVAKTFVHVDMDLSKDPRVLWPY